MSISSTNHATTIARRLIDDVLTPMKSDFIGKDEVIDLLGVSLVAKENLFILGPPGTAKTAIVHQLCRRINGKTFDYLLTRFTEPNELFGPFDIRRLKEGELVTNTEGMIPEADIIFLDELLNANSAILNSLLMVLNERVFRRGRETRNLPALMVVGASNQLPQDDSLAALFDRFLLRVVSENVAGELLPDVLSSGWRMNHESVPTNPTVSIDDVRRLQHAVSSTEVSSIRTAYVELVSQLRRAGFAVSDRRAVKLQRMIAASALLCGRTKAHPSDFWVLRYIWDREEEREVLQSIVNSRIEQDDHAPIEDVHPRSKRDDLPDPEILARDLQTLEDKLIASDINESERARVRDRVSALSRQCVWVKDTTAKTHLTTRLELLWKRIESSPT